MRNLERDTEKEKQIVLSLQIYFCFYKSHNLWKLMGVLPFLRTRIHQHTRIHPYKCASGFVDNITQN